MKDSCHDERKAARQQLAAVIISTRALKSNLQEVALHNSDLARRARRFIASCRLRRYAFLKAVDAGKPTILRAVAADTAPDQETYLVPE